MGLQAWRPSDQRLARLLRYGTAYQEVAYVHLNHFSRAVEAVPMGSCFHAHLPPAWLPKRVRVSEREVVERCASSVDALTAACVNVMSRLSSITSSLLVFECI